MLPGMDGYQLSQLIKHNLKYSDIPIIMISAKVSKEDQKLGFEKGADDYITKPFEPSYLIERIKKFISL
jgi:DNA-binding response OmpR family regulator